MSKKIGLIAEDDSDIDVIATILEKYTPKNKFSVKKFVGKGCGKLKLKCDAWTEHLFKSGCEHVLIFHDLDRNNEQELSTLLRNKVPEHRFPNSLIVIPIEELEAWLLSDSLALSETFKLKKLPRKISNCDSIPSPKEHLRDLVWNAEKKIYLNTIHNKKIVEKMSLENLRRCKSYRSFDNYIKKNIFP